ncbi:hypothetical protein DL95DRAFT_388015 [Leptodontidium sp. 2 PMI_412]|nr:hypothetical protein DL95DRAFT_388015 [Leptodontidium sp. 2 PMI_412]
MTVSTFGLDSELAHVLEARHSTSMSGFTEEGTLAPRASLTLSKTSLNHSSTDPKTSPITSHTTTIPYPRCATTGAWSLRAVTELSSPGRTATSSTHSSNGSTIPVSKVKTAYRSRSHQHACRTNGTYSIDTQASSAASSVGTMRCMGKGAAREMRGMDQARKGLVSDGGIEMFSS